MPGNRIVINRRSDAVSSLPGLDAELLVSIAPLLSEALPASAVDWLTGLLVAALPEDVPAPTLFDAADATLSAIIAAPSARGWAAALARFELLLLADMGFGLALDRCVVSGDTGDLAFVSPRSGGAVSRAAAAGHEQRLFPLPPFLTASGGVPYDMAECLTALRLTGHFVERAVLRDRRDDLAGVRARLIDRLERVVAPGAGAA